MNKVKEIFIDAVPKPARTLFYPAKNQTVKLNIL